MNRSFKFQTLLSFLIISFLAGSHLAAFAQDTKKESNSQAQNNPVQNGQAQNPEKPKTYREKYLEFYDPKNYSKNYKDRYQGKNYRQYKRELREENQKTFKNSLDYLGAVNENSYDLMESAKHANSSNPSMFNVDKYGRQYNPYANNYNTGSPTTIDRSQLHFRSEDVGRGYDYYMGNYDYLYDNEMGGVTVRPSAKQSPRPWDDVKDGHLGSNPLPNSLFSGQRRQSNMPTTTTIQLPEPMPDSATGTTTATPNYNPFQLDPTLLPPHLISPASPEITPSENPDATGLPLPNAPTSQEKPAELIPSSTASINNASPQTNPANPVYQPPQKQFPIQQPPAQAAAPQTRSPMQLLYEQGVKSFAQRQYTKSRQVFEKLTAANPGSPYAHFGYGLSLFYAADYTKSWQEFQQSQDLTTQKQIPSPNLWQMQTQPEDFRFHFRKLANYVELNPDAKDAKELLFYLSRISSKSPAAQ